MRNVLRTFRRSAVPQRSLLALALLGACGQLAVAQSIQRTVVEGRVVWTNDGPSTASEARTAKAAAHARSIQSGSRDTARESGFVYWSMTEHRWVPVRLVPRVQIRKARAAAGEVAHSMGASAQDKEHGGSAMLSDVSSTPVPLNRRASSAELEKVIEQAAARHHVDPNLVKALIKVESNFNPRALSNKGAMGLMQLMPATARMYDVNNPFDPAENVDAGVRHLKGLLQNFGGDVSLSLAAYNAGQGAVMRSGGIPPYAETQNYVRRITGLYGGRVSMASIGASSAPIHITRDANGAMMFSNTD